MKAELIARVVKNLGQQGVETTPEAVDSFLYGDTWEDDADKLMDDISEKLGYQVPESSGEYQANKAFWSAVGVSEEEFATLP